MKTNAIFASASVLLALMSGCASKSNDVADANNPVTVINFCDSTTAVNNQIIIPIDLDNIIAFEDSEDWASKGFGTDVVGDDMIITNGSDVFLYNIPTGKKIRSVSHLGKEQNEYRHISDVVCGDDGLWIVESHWQDSTSVLRLYGGTDNELMSAIKKGHIGDLAACADSGYLATNALSFAGGDFYLYRLDKSFNAVDSVFLKHRAPRKDIFQETIGIGHDGKSFITVFNDTIFSISQSLELAPVVALDYGDKKMPDSISHMKYPDINDFTKAISPYINLTWLKKCDDLLFSRYELEDNIYLSIFDCNTGERLLHSKITNDNYGLNLDVNSTTIYPEICGIWDGNLLIKIPADDAAKITGNACAAIAMLPIDTLRGKLSQPDK